MEGSIESINHNQAARIGRQEQPLQKQEDLARAFIAAFKQADELAQQVTNSKKKEREDDERRRRHFTKEDYHSSDEIEEILAEIDKRLEKMLEIARSYDA